MHAAPRGGGLVVDCSGAGDFSTIQSAIVAAQNGDVVIVLPNTCEADGRWHEDLDFLGKAIIVQSTDPSDDEIVQATLVTSATPGPIVRFETGETADAVLDGLTLIGGATMTIDMASGIQIGAASPTIRRCVFQGDPATNGHGVRMSSSQLATFESCKFLGFSPPGDFADAAVVSCDTKLPRFDGCRFQGNQRAILNTTVAAGSGPETSGFHNCQFLNNTVADTSKLFFVWTRLNVTGSTFTDNRGCLYASSWMMTGTRFERSIVSGQPLIDGGPLWLLEDTDFVECTAIGKSLIDLAPYRGPIRNCHFEGNQTPTNGIIDLRGDFGIESCDFIANMTSSGVIIGRTGSWRIDGCTFIGNRTPYIGAAIKLPSNVDAQTAVVSNCVFQGNYAGSRGGAIYGPVGRIENSLFVGNASEQQGGAIHSDIAVVDGCTVVGNRIWGIVSGVIAREIHNSIIWNNRGLTEGAFNQSQLALASNTNPQYCNIDAIELVNGGNYNPPPGEDTNFSADPGFVDPGHWDDMGTPGSLAVDVFVPGDYHLLSFSPCIDAGDPDFVAAEGATDLDAEPRMQSCRVDMGVDEFTQADSTPGDFDGDSIVTASDVPGFVVQLLHPTVLGRCASDVNGDGFVDGRDIAAMVSLILGV